MNWQPISTAPKVEDVRILLSDGNQAVTAEWCERWIRSPFTWEGGDEGRIAEVPFQPTHWCPIELPGGKSGT